MCWHLQIRLQLFAHLQQSVWDWAVVSVNQTVIVCRQVASYQATCASVLQKWSPRASVLLTELWGEQVQLVA